MKTYREWAPTKYDSKGIFLSDRQDWLVLPVLRSRDATVLEESNFETALDRLAGKGEGDYEIHRFGHWANGWFEIILVRPGTPAAKEAEAIEAKLDDYPILDENDHSMREYEAAQEEWEQCFSMRDRIAFIRKHRSDFEFDSLADMLACVRGEFFNGNPGDIVQ